MRRPSRLRVRHVHTCALVFGRRLSRHATQVRACFSFYSVDPSSHYNAGDIMNSLRTHVEHLSSCTAIYMRNLCCRTEKNSYASKPARARPSLRASMVHSSCKRARMTLRRSRRCTHLGAPTLLCWSVQPHSNECKPVRFGARSRDDSVTLNNTAYMRARLCICMQACALTQLSKRCSGSGIAVAHALLSLRCICVARAAVTKVLPCHSRFCDQGAAVSLAPL
eukprot:2441325-Pleurochrysis_carterae.AAC.4